MASYESLKAIVDDLEASLSDAQKFDGGNASAGTRVRKAAQEAKKALQDLRLSIQETKNSK